LTKTRARRCRSLARRSYLGRELPTPKRDLPARRHKQSRRLEHLRGEERPGLLLEPARAEAKVSRRVLDTNEPLRACWGLAVRCQGLTTARARILCRVMPELGPISLKACSVLRLDTLEPRRQVSQSGWEIGFRGVGICSSGSPDPHRPLVGESLESRSTWCDDAPSQKATRNELWLSLVVTMRLGGAERGHYATVATSPKLGSQSACSASVWAPVSRPSGHGCPAGRSVPW
jgi:hypothetical protein